jgi:stage II sporulation protein GA (sporulation sigma-E factor processing peptidase)
MRVLYLDTLFFLNYGLDYLALYFAGRLMKLPTRQWRLLLAALPGAAFAAAAVLWLGESPWYYLGFVLVGALMVWIGFGRDAGRTRLLLCTVAQLGAAILLGGVISALYHVLNGLITPGVQMPISAGEGILLLAVLSGGVIKLAFAVLDRRGGGDRVRVTVEAFGRKCKLLLYVDSGNLLRDPLDGKQVIVLSRRAMTALPIFVRRSLETGQPEGEMKRRMRVIPTHSVGGDRLLYGFVPDSVTDEKGRRFDAVVAMGNGDDFGGNDGLISSNAGV